MELRALVSASNSSRAFDLRCYVRENLIKYIQLHLPEGLSKNRYQLAADNHNDRPSPKDQVL
jgi:hypothetical protein